MRLTIFFLMVLIGFGISENPAEARRRGSSCGGGGGQCGGCGHSGSCQDDFRDIRDIRDIRDFQNQNFRELNDSPNFQDFEQNFRDTGSPFLRRNQFDATFDPGFGLTGGGQVNPGFSGGQVNPGFSGGQVDPGFSGAPAAPGLPGVSVNKVAKTEEESPKEKYLKGQKPEDSQGLLGSSWKGKCQKGTDGERTIKFTFPEATKITERTNSAILEVSESESYEMKVSQDGTELLIKITNDDEVEYCALKRN